jgi:hypothetical protein
MSTLKQIGVGLCVVVVVCAGMLWVTLGPEVKAEANRAAEAQRVAGAVRRAGAARGQLDAYGGVS